MVAEQIDKTFWIGTSQAPALLVANGKVKGVLNCALDLDIDAKTLIPPDADPLQNPVYMKVGLLDGPGNSTYALISAALAIRQMVDLKASPVLVHCHSGSSRSVAVLALYLAWQRKWTIGKAVGLIKSKRSLAAPKPALINLAERSLNLLNVLLW